MRVIDKGVYMYLADRAKFKEWREYRGLSLSELARAADVSKQFVHQLESGTRRTCKPKTARSFEKFLLPPQNKRTPDEAPLFVARLSGKTGETSGTVGDQV